MALQGDHIALSKVAREVAKRADELLQDFPLNHYSRITERADALRLLRASIELAPTLPPEGT